MPEEFEAPPGWEYWRGVNGAFYARRLRTSPPIVFRAETPEDLRRQVLEYIAGHQARWEGARRY
jgi:hypothetical protein